MLLEYIDINGLPREHDRVLTWTQTQVTIAATSTTLLAADTTCKAVRFQNISDAAIDVSLDGTAATTSDGLRVDPGEMLMLDDIDRDNTTLAFYAIDSSGVGSRYMRVLKGV